MSFPYYSDVERAYADLKAEGKIAPRADAEQVEHDKGLLTQRAGWYVFQKNPTIGVLEKTTGNNYQGYSVDILIRLDGIFWDVATDNGVEALPVNGGPSGPDPELIPRWRQPTAELAQVPDTPPTPEPEPEPGPDTDDILDAIAECEAAIKAHMTAETDRVMQRLADYRAEVIDFAELAGKVLAAIWAKRHQPPA